MAHTRCCELSKLRKKDDGNRGENKMAGEEGGTMALNLEGVEVGQAEVERQQGQVRLTVLPQWPVAGCPHCGQGRTQVQQTRDVAGVQDLPLADQAVELCVRVSQFWWTDCQGALTPALPAVAEGAHATEQVLACAAELLRQGDVARAAAFLRVPAKALERWYYAGGERQPQSGKVRPSTSLGIDELSRKKSTSSSSR
jgi:transposase